MKVPALLEGEQLTWAPEQEQEAPENAREQTLVLAQPGHPDALGLTLGCVRIKGHKVCLECGWLYCRIVIKGTF
jgi:hypothetical protein